MLALVLQQDLHCPLLHLVTDELCGFSFGQEMLLGFSKNDIVVGRKRRGEPSEDIWVLKMLNYLLLDGFDYLFLVFVCEDHAVDVFV